MTVGRFLGYAFAGWAAEALLRGRPTWSLVWGGRKIPLLPIFGIGGLIAEGMAAKLRGKPLPTRALAYGAALTAYELASCKVSETLYGSRTWDYDGKCVDLPHAALWAAAGLEVEAATRRRHGNGEAA